MGKNPRDREGCLTLREAVGRGIRPAVILVPVLIFVTLILAGTAAPEQFMAVLNAVFAGLMVHGG